MELLLLIGIAAGVLGCLLLLLFKRQNGETLQTIQQQLQTQQEVQRAQNQQVLDALHRTQSSLVAAIQSLSQSVEKLLSAQQLELAQQQLVFADRLTQLLQQHFSQLLGQINQESTEQRQRLAESLQQFKNSVTEHMASFKEHQAIHMQQISSQQQQLIQHTEKQLENMRATVDEKLTKTLHERLGHSFAMVGKQLESVQKGLGEMQTIAADVGGLKKVLSNVKLRGGLGEIQLAMLLEQLLAPQQYDANVRTRPGSNDPVEFAIKLPGKSEDENNFVYLPIDAKFPKDVYEQLMHAYDNALPEEVEQASKQLEQTIKKMAKDIRDKYIAPPYTTDFAILFLPFESIYAEVIRRSGLIDQLREEFKIIVAGPTTLAALLNSLQMGFRTLALQKRSSEVWQILGAVKSEFNKFGELLLKAQKNIQTAGNTVEELLGKRTKAIARTLREVEQLPAAASGNWLTAASTEDNTLDEE